MGVTENLGSWDAATNTPELVSGVGQTNGYYIVSVDGSTELDGESDWKVDDWVYFTGTAWKKIDNTEELGGSSENQTQAITYVSSIENFIPGSPLVATQFDLHLAQPLPFKGRLIYVSEEIYNTQLTQELLFSLPFGMVFEWSTVVSFYGSSVPGAGNPGIKMYVVYVPSLELGGGVLLPFSDVLFPIAEITAPIPQTLDEMSQLEDSSFYEKNFLQVEINNISVMDELRYLHSKSMVNNLYPSISTLNSDVATLQTDLAEVEDSLSNKLDKTGGTLTGPVTTQSHIFLYGGTSNNSLAAVSREAVQNMLTSYVRTVLAGDIAGNQKNISNLNRLGANEIGGVNLYSGTDVHASVLKTNTIKAPQSAPFVDTELTIKKADSDDPHQEMMKFFSYWAGNVADSRDHNGETASIIIRPYIRQGLGGVTTSYNLIQTNSRISMKAPINETGLLHFVTEGGLAAGGIYIDQTTNDVVYSNFCGSHPSQLITTEEIKLGSVMESLDEMCEWESVPEKRLPKAQLCLTEESSSVYGVFTGKDDDGDPIISAVGLSYCRIASGIVVKKGDLLVSNGDGCARVQSDDIIRSKTIGKVISATVAHTYEDGSYTVPVALYCG